MAEQKLVTYRVFFSNGTERKVTVPQSWKVTFGTLHPGQKDSYRDGNVLRFYETKDKQRAVFTNVSSFMDITNLQSVLKVVDSKEILEVTNNVDSQKRIVEKTDKFVWIQEN